MQLSLNKGWICIFSLMAITVTILFFTFAHAAWGYFSLNRQTLGRVEVFFVRQLEENMFGVEAHYSYVICGVEYKDKKVLTNPKFLNEYAAQTHLQKYWKAQPWPVWYNAKHPEVSSLQKIFPVKKLLSFILSLGILLYFLWLQQYVKRQMA